MSSIKCFNSIHLFKSTIFLAKAKLVWPLLCYHCALCCVLEPTVPNSVVESNNLVRCVFGNSRFLPSRLQAPAWRAQPPRLIPAAGVAAKALPRTWRGWATRQTSLQTMMLRECGALRLSRASKRPWPSILHAEGGRLSCLTRERCMVSTEL